MSQTTIPIASKRVAARWDDFCVDILAHPSYLESSVTSVRDLEIVPMTRQQLVDLLVRVHIAEGMKVEQARIHAEVLVDQYIISLTK